MHVEHELRKRPVHARNLVLQHHKAGAGEFRRRIEIDLPEARAKVDVVFRLEIELARLTDAPNLGVVVGRFADWYAGVRQIRNYSKKPVEFRLRFFQLLLECFELVCLRRDFRHQRRGVFTLGFRLPHLLGELVAFCLQLLGLCLHRFAVGLQPLEPRRIQRHAAVGKPCGDARQIIAQQLNIQHYNPVIASD